MYMDALEASALTAQVFRGQLPLVVLESIHDPVNVIDRDFRVLWANHTGSEMAGLPRRELHGRLCFQAFLGRERPCLDCPAEEVFSTGSSCVMQKWLQLSNGVQAWGEVRAYPVFDHLGQVNSVVKIGFNITDQKNEQARRERYLASLEKSLYESVGEEPNTLADDEFNLSKRERQVLRFLASGFTNKDIARLLCISPHTVKTHVVNVFNKLGVNDRAQAAVWAARLRLV